MSPEKHQFTLPTVTELPPKSMMDAVTLDDFAGPQKRPEAIIQPEAATENITSIPVHEDITSARGIIKVNQRRPHRAHGSRAIPAH